MLIKPAKITILFALFVAACGAAQEPAKGPAEGGTSIAEGEVCPSIAAAAPDQKPSCPEGCEWKGTECRASRPIVIYDRPIATGTSTSTAPTLPAPTSTAPSTP
ncbi:MAG: hypothetical protein IPK82_24545 [Polyangiaceae bacterium]|nr:hypothetical protein [Polyangiaceae bacterium]